jgi:hypothetical protein
LGDREVVDGYTCRQCEAYTRAQAGNTYCAADGCG